MIPAYLTFFPLAVIFLILAFGNEIRLPLWFGLVPPSVKSTPQNPPQIEQNQKELQPALQRHPSVIIVKVTSSESSKVQVIGDDDVFHDCSQMDAEEMLTGMKCFVS